MDPNSSDLIGAATLYYRINDPLQTQPYHAVVMTNTTGDTWTAVIPGSAVGPEGVDYYISAWDNNEVRADHGTAEAPHYFATDCNDTTVYQWDFEDGWGDYWSADGGVWQIGHTQHPGRMPAAVVRSVRQRFSTGIILKIQTVV